MDKEAFAIRLSLLRTKMNISARDMSLSLGQNPGYINSIESGKALGTNGEAGSYVFTDKAEAQFVLIQMLEEAGVEVLYDTRVCLAEKDGDAVKAVVVCTQQTDTSRAKGDKRIDGIRHHHTAQNVGNNANKGSRYGAKHHTCQKNGQIFKAEAQHVAHGKC